MLPKLSLTPKKLILIFLLAFSLIGLFAISIFLLNIFKESQAPPNTTYLSPLPNKLTTLLKGVTHVGKKIDQEPFPNNEPLTKEDPKITAESAISIDLTTNKIIYEKNGKIRRPIASTLKIMTAILAIENADPEKEITISNAAANIGEDVMITSPGEKYTLRELLYGLLMLSANDAAEAIAESIFTRRELFIAIMNSKAEELGLKDTKFVNPTGLDGDGGHYGTAYDLFIMARYAMKLPLFKEIVKTKEYLIEATEKHKGQLMVSQTNLLGTYPGVAGIKTGYTPEAGLCLITYAENGGHEVIAVVLGSTDRRGDMKKILDLSFKTLGIKVPKHD